MLNLSAKIIAIKNVKTEGPGMVLRVADRPVDDADRSAYLARSVDSALPAGFALYLLSAGAASLATKLEDRPWVLLPEDLHYLAHGDIVRVSPHEQRIRVLYRVASSHNHFLVTERCDNYCLMCSQPPRNVNDDWVVEEILQTIPLMHPKTAEIGFTGGEPTLLGERFLDVLRACKTHLPNTAVHVLSNGRRFSDYAFAEQWASIEHPDLMVGIPLYSDCSTMHDFVVQADGAYDETIRGILNLKRLNQRVELRVVLHQYTYKHLPRLAEFLSRNLLFVDHVALMGLEIMGFARANLDTLWVDPVDYQDELRVAVSILDASGMRVSIYNLQLCLLDESLWPFAVQSISDWKREYAEECGGCSVREQCGGFFFSAKYKRSSHIRPIVQQGITSNFTEQRA